MQLVIVYPFWIRKTNAAKHQAERVIPPRRLNSHICRYYNDGTTGVLCNPAAEHTPNGVTYQKEQLKNWMLSAYGFFNTKMTVHISVS